MMRAGPAVVVLTAASLAAAMAAADWNQYRGGPERSGFATWSGTTPPAADVVWSVPIGQAQAASPVIGPDGTIYVAARRGADDLLAFRPDGTDLWASSLGGHDVQSTPAVLSIGGLVVTGTKWRRQVEDGVFKR
jgi:outer membrane protein assembly factor BamB